MAPSEGRGEIQAVLGQLHRGRLPCDPADLVANPIDQAFRRYACMAPTCRRSRLIEIGHNVEHCFLDKTGGIVFRARAPGNGPCAHTSSKGRLRSTRASRPARSPSRARATRPDR